MNNYLCPFCNSKLIQILAQAYPIKGKEIKEYYYSCNQIACKNINNNNFPRWSFYRWENNPVNYYQARIEHNNYIHIIQGSAGSWTKLYNDGPTLGSMQPSAIIELPFISLQEPLLPHLQSIIKKMKSLIIFI